MNLYHTCDQEVIILNIFWNYCVFLYLVVKYPYF